MAARRLPADRLPKRERIASQSGATHYVFKRESVRGMELVGGAFVLTADGRPVCTDILEGVRTESIRRSNGPRLRKALRCPGRDSGRCCGRGVREGQMCGQANWIDHFDEEWYIVEQDRACDEIEAAIANGDAATAAQAGALLGALVTEERIILGWGEFVTKALDEADARREAGARSRRSTDEARLKAVKNLLRRRPDLSLTAAFGIVAKRFNCSATTVKRAWYAG